MQWLLLFTLLCPPAAALAQLPLPDALQHLLEVARHRSELGADPTPVPAEAQVLSFHRADLPPSSTEVMVGQVLTEVNPLTLMPGAQEPLEVRFRVGTDGRVSFSDGIETSNPLQRAPVLTALKQWRFRVSYRDRTPVAVVRVFRFLPGGGEEALP